MIGREEPAVPQKCVGIREGESKERYGLVAVPREDGLAGVEDERGVFDASQEAFEVWRRRVWDCWDRCG